MTAVAVAPPAEVTSIEVHAQLKSLSPVMGPGASPASVMTPLAPQCNMSAANHHASQWQLVQEEGRNATRRTAAAADVPTGSCDSPTPDVTDVAAASVEPPHARPPPPAKQSDYAGRRAPTSAAGAAAAADVAVLGAAAAAPAPSSAASRADDAHAHAHAATPAPTAPRRPFRTSQEIFFGRPAALFSGYPVRRRERAWAPLR